MSKLPIIEKAKLKTVVTIKALRGSPLFDIFASGPKNGTTPSAEMACATHDMTLETSSETRLKQNLAAFNSKRPLSFQARPWRSIAWIT